jgi:hypothetical protein
MLTESYHFFVIERRWVIFGIVLAVIVALVVVLLFRKRGPN